METVEEIKHDANFVSGIELDEYGLSAYLIHQGTALLKYIVFWQGIILFSGADFKPSPLHKIESLETICSLLQFICQRPGDTDKEHFSAYNARQMEWVKSEKCELLQAFLSGFEDRNSVFHKQSREYLEMRFCL